MATLTIRNVPEGVHQALRRRAAENARSVEAEVRALLEAAVLGDVRTAGVAEETAPFRADAGAPSVVGMWGASSPGRSEVDRFIAQRRIEAAYEGDEITADEYAELNRRLDAWEVEGVERFLSKRRGEA